MFHKILVAIDDSDQHKTVFESTLALAKEMNVRLMLLHVLSLNEPQNLALPVFSSYYPTVSEELIRQFQAEQKALENRGLERLRALASAAKTAGVIAEFTQNVGDPSELICAIAQSWGADLIAIGRRAHSRLNELVLGSVSNYVLHHAPCSVLVVQNQAEVQSETSSESEVSVN